MAKGDGSAFKKLKGELARKPGITDPAALAASIGRKKYGTEEFQAMAAAGRRRANREVSRKRERSRA